MDRNHRLKFYLASSLGWIALIIAHSKGLQNPGAWLEGWFRWDSEWYARIWDEGYGHDLRMLVFPPGYAWLIGVASQVTGSLHLAAALINVGAYFAAGVAATEFAIRRFRVPYWKFYLFYLSAPVGFYTFSVYSDAVFLLFFWLGVSLADRDPLAIGRRDKFTAAALLFFAPWIRLTGFPLLIWVAFRRWWAATTLLTFALWLGLNHYLSGDALHFLKAQAEFAMPAGGFLEGLKQNWGSLWPPPQRIDDTTIWFWYQVTVLPFLSMVILTMTGVWLLWRRQTLLAVTLLTVMVFSRNQAYWRSVVRYDWPLWPFIAIPLLYKPDALGLPSIKTWHKRTRDVLYWALVLAGLYIQLIFAARMHEGHWIF